LAGEIEGFREGRRPAPARLPRLGEWVGWAQRPHVEAPAFRGRRRPADGPTRRRASGPAGRRQPVAQREDDPARGLPSPSRERPRRQCPVASGALWGRDKTPGSCTLIRQMRGPGVSAEATATGGVASKNRRPKGYFPLRLSVIGGGLILFMRIV